MDQNAPVQTGETPVVPTPPPTPTFTVTPKKKFPKWILLVLVILAVLSWGIFFWQKSKSEPALTNKVVTSANLPKESAQPAKLSDKIIYATLDPSGKMDVYASDFSGREQKLYEEASVSAAFSTSHDNSMLAYRSANHPNSLSIYDLLAKAGKAYPLEASSDAVEQVSWNNSGKELLMIAQDKDRVIKLEKLSLAGGQIENITQGSSDNFGTFPQTAGFWRMDQSAHTFLTTGELCAPGPCYNKMLSYDWQTGELKDILDFGKVQIDGKFADIDPSGKRALFDNAPIDGYMPPQLLEGKLSFYNLADGTNDSLLDTKGVSYTNASFADSKTLFYNLVSSDKEASADANPSSQWYEMNLDSKKSQQINYSGYDFVPFNEQVGLINHRGSDGNELDILNLSSGKKVQLFKSADTQIYLLNSVF